MTGVVKEFSKRYGFIEINDEYVFFPSRLAPRGLKVGDVVKVQMIEGRITKIETDGQAT